VPLTNVTTATGQSCATIDTLQTGSWTDSFQNIRCYDTLKVNAILNQIRGKRHDGSKTAPVPAVFGMNFQAVSVGQKLIEYNDTTKTIVATGGYVDDQGTPSDALLAEIEFVDAAIGAFSQAINSQDLADSTLIVITAKHGGFAHDDTNVITLVSHPGLQARTVTSPVETSQVAPTVLQALGLSPQSLEAVCAEGTQALPGLLFEH